MGGDIRLNSTKKGSPEGVPVAFVMAVKQLREAVLKNNVNSASKSVS